MHPRVASGTTKYRTKASLWGVIAVALGVLAIIPMSMAYSSWSVTAATLPLFAFYIDGLLSTVAMRCVSIDRVEWLPGDAGDIPRLRLTLSTRTYQAVALFARIARQHTTTWARVVRGTPTVVDVEADAPLARGVYSLPPLELRSMGLFGLCWAQLHWQPDAERDLWVMPEAWVGTLPTRMTATGTPDTETDEDAEAPVAAPMGTLATEETAATGNDGWLRAWRPGDRWQHIAHKASARRDELLVCGRLREEDPEQGWNLSWTWALGQAQGHPELALSLLRSLIDRLTEQHTAVGLTLPTGQWLAATGPLHREQLLEALARMPMSEGA